VNVRPITPTTPACFGVCCPKHGQCTRYEAVNGPEGANAIATCDDAGGNEWPLFVRIRANVAEPAHS